MDKSDISLVIPGNQTLRLISPLNGATMSDILDATLVSDFVIFLFSPTELPDSTLLSALKAQGIPTIIPIVQNIENVGVKKVQVTKRDVAGIVKYHFSDDIPLHFVDTRDHCNALLRTISQTRPKGITWREQYAYCVAESLAFSPNVDDPTKGAINFYKFINFKGTLAVTGYVRGATLDPNRLVHLQKHGDFQIQSIKVMSPHTTKHGSGMEIDEGTLYFPEADKQVCGV